MHFLPIFFSLIFSAPFPVAEQINGAWSRTDGNINTVLIFQDEYFTMTKYTASAFLETSGGTFSFDGRNLKVREEFNTAQKELKVVSIPVSLEQGVLIFGKDKMKLQRVDDGNATLSGVWQISAHVRDGKIVPVQHTGTRKTLKILTGKRFQWFAIDPAKNSFSGTGGGTYSFTPGKYVENIEFFSRDSTRVGSSLPFEDEVKEGKWHHTGLSSKGDKIYEIWEKVY